MIASVTALVRCSLLSLMETRQIQCSSAQLGFACSHLIFFTQNFEFKEVNSLLCIYTFKAKFGNLVRFEKSALLFFFHKINSDAKIIEG